MAGGYEMTLTDEEIKAKMQVLMPKDDPLFNALVSYDPDLARGILTLFMNDAGFLNSFYSAEVRLKILHHDQDINNGALFENAVTQQLTANGFHIFYYKSKKSGASELLRSGMCSSCRKQINAGAA